jgi:hypothetical protein
MSRTLRAALIGALIGFASIAGLGVFLGFAVVGSLVAGVVTGALAGLLLWGAARRAESFHPVDAARPVEPGFPGPPDPPADEARRGDDEADRDR